MADSKTRTGSHKSVPFVNPGELGLPFNLFQVAVLDFASPTTPSPLSGPYVQRCIIDEDAVERGRAVLRVHFEHPDQDNPVMMRLNSFVLLLREVDASPTPLWKTLSGHYDRYIPILHAIAWCPVAPGKPFDQNAFLQIAERAPAGIDISPRKTM